MSETSEQYSAFTAEKQEIEYEYNPNYSSTTVKLDQDQEFGTVKRDLKSRHLQMIAVGGTIGTGIFLSSGGSVAAAGPLGALISYTIVGTMVFFIVDSLGEMSAYLPLPGAFTTFGARFVDPALGFGLGVGYAFQWIITVTIEVTAAGMILQYWWPHLKMWIPALVFIVLLVGVTLLGVKAFGELEYWLSMIKVLTCVIFIIIGILVDTGAVGGRFIGGENWHIDQAPIVGEDARDFGGTELIGITAGVSSNPAKARILLFYILSVTVIGLCIPWTDPNLLNSVYAEVNEAATIAPFTIVIKMANLPGADHAINAVLLTAVLSAGQSSFYASTRTLMAMGREGKMPAIFGRVNSRGVPLYSLAFVTAIASIAFVADVVGTGIVFEWLVNLTGMSALLTWMSISIIHLRFRAAFKAQDRSLSDLPYIAPLFPYSCYISIALSLMIVFLQGYQAVTADPFEVKGIVAVFVGAPVFFATILGWKLYHKTKLVPLMEVDLDSGRQIIMCNSPMFDEARPKPSIWRRLIHFIA
ncbi:hypothetical protein FBU30_009577 [Linnemannia zychae]|nr:hypothetical protein FBU30_009577 [Linnemannia zychae]